jgi:hypothetical protein
MKPSILGSDLPQIQDALAVDAVQIPEWVGGLKLAELKDKNLKT